MIRHFVAVVLLFVAVSSASAQSPQPPAELAISFEERAVTASGATASGKVAWFSVAREINEFAARIVKRQATVDASVVGETTFELDDPLPRQAIWVAVDVETGRFAVAADPMKRGDSVIVDGLGKSIPDFLSGRGLIEFKNQQEISFSVQLRIQAAAARIRGVPLNLVVSPETRRVSQRLRDAVEASGGRVFIFDPTNGVIGLWGHMP